MSRRVAALFIALSMVGCARHARVKDVAGPNGQPAHQIRCSDSSLCYEAADEVCGDGYILISSHMAAGGSAELLVGCRSDGYAQKPQGDPAATACDAIFKHASEFSPYWVEQSNGGQALQTPPEARDFRAVCVTLPENVRRCMFEAYRSAHGPSCDAMLSRIEPATRNKIDSLFLAAPPHPNRPAADGAAGAAP